ncbi:HNH endonuclease [Cupriavidus plantarum]|uniref:HNH endonuclease n=1 Tax=Cupriavidus plantarum TaxID=942865 RepID=UPI001BA77E47|nr:HNH endonuclease [Cupriavidus plantarum]
MDEKLGREIVNASSTAKLHKLERTLEQNGQLNEAVARAIKDRATELSLPSRKKVRNPRNPNWSRDELILALQLYLQRPGSPPGKHSKEVAELSQVLRDIGKVLGARGGDTYRNPNGVYMKMMNFRRFDPVYTKDGKTGLKGGNADEEVVWAEFADDPDELSAVCDSIRSAVRQYVGTTDLHASEDHWLTEAKEGRLLTRVHQVRERNRALVKKAKANALKIHGRLFCEACGFDFEKTYGVRGKGMIEVHHTKPLHTIAEGEVTRVEDLAMLCANCHRVVHSSRSWLSVEDVSRLVRKATS